MRRRRKERSSLSPMGGAKWPNHIYTTRVRLHRTTMPRPVSTRCAAVSANYPMRPYAILLRIVHSLLSNPGTRDRVFPCLIP